MEEHFQCVLSSTRHEGGEDEDALPEETDDAVDSNAKVEEVHKDGDHEDMDAKLQEAWDDVSGATLDPKDVGWARLKEIQYIEDNKAWRRIPRPEALRRGYKNVKGRLIDVNKGDSTNCKKKSRYRSRYVAEEFNTGDEDGPFASTPPLEALRLIISDVATRDQEEDKVIVVNDVARRFSRHQQGGQSV